MLAGYIVIAFLTLLTLYAIEPLDPRKEGYVPFWIGAIFWPIFVPLLLVGLGAILIHKGLLKFLGK
jgi:hypothetical protein